jgi:mannose-6-phosphate isomerase-like protein (cupin superfamily)
LYNFNNQLQTPFYVSEPYFVYTNTYQTTPNLYRNVNNNNHDNSSNTPLIPIKDYGGKPFTVNIEEITKRNNTYRTALWTGDHLQLTLMSIDVGDDIGLEVHPNVDQFIRIEDGDGMVLMGDSKDNLNYQARVTDDYIFIVPAGKWHNLVNTGNKPIKLYSIYAPANHPFGTVHQTKKEAEIAERFKTLY